MSTQNNSNPSDERPSYERRVIDETMRTRLVSELSPVFQGDLLGPADSGYEARRTVWNAMVDKSPGLIAYCTSTEDVVAVVNAARIHRLDFSVRGGGHSVVGASLSDGGLTIDLGGMRHVAVDPVNKTVEAGGGCLLADLDSATASHGLAVPMGTVSETGLGGLALGGGIGWLSRRFGLTCDNFLSLEVVLANGSVVQATSTSHSALFWALQGGGGNFGVVTRFQLRAHSFGPKVLMGVAMYQPEEATSVLREYAQRLPRLPRTIGWNVSMKSRMPPYPFVPAELVGKRLLMLISMWLDDADSEDGKREIESLNRIGNPCLATTAVIPFAESVQKIMDEEFADGYRCYVKQFHLASLSDSIMDSLVHFWKNMEVDGYVGFMHTGGAISDLSERESAFGNRKSALWMVLDTHWRDRSQDPANLEQLHRLSDEVTSSVEAGAYINMMSSDELGRVVEAFGGYDNFAVLRRVKTQYDPSNLFQSNWNIPPLAGLRY